MFGANRRCRVLSKYSIPNRPSIGSNLLSFAIIPVWSKNRTAPESNKMRKQRTLFKLGQDQKVTEVRERFAVLPTVILTIRTIKNYR